MLVALHAPRSKVMHAFLKDPVPNGTDNALIAMFRNMEDQELDQRQVKRVRIYLIQL